MLFSDGLGNDLDPADIRQARGVTRRDRGQRLCAPVLLLKPPLLRTQGKLAANVWLLSALAVITEYPDAVPLLFTDRTRGLQDLTKVRAQCGWLVHAPAALTSGWVALRYGCSSSPRASGASCPSTTPSPTA